MTPRKPAPGAATPLDPKIWQIAGVVLLAPLMTNLDSTVVNVSLSTLGRDLHATLTTIQWVVSGYLLALALVLPLNGWLVDRIGAKRLYIACFTGFTLASTFCGLARSPEFLIAARVLQGCMGGLLAPMAQMMTARAAGRHMARVMGIMTIPVLLGPICGPVLGGAIVRYASWRYIFFINVPIGILATVLALRILPKDQAATQARAFDWLGFLLISPGLVLFLHSLKMLSSKSGFNLQSETELLVSLGMLLGFGIHAHRKRARALVDLSLFRGPVFNAAALTQFLANAGALGGQMLLPLYLIMARNLSPSQAGMLLAPAGLGMLCSYPMMGPVIERFGSRRVSATGSLLAFLATLPFALLAVKGLSVPTIGCALFLRGVGLSGIGLPSLTAAYASVPKPKLAAATTAINIAQRLGGPTATTVLAIFLHSMIAHLPPGSAGPAALVRGQAPAFAATFWLLCAIHAVTALAALRLPLWPPHKETDAFGEREQAVEAISE